jgi:hypothetical protein
VHDVGVNKKHSQYQHRIFVITFVEILSLAITILSQENELAKVKKARISWEMKKNCVKDYVSHFARSNYMK